MNLMYENIEFLRFHFAKRDYVPELKPMTLSYIDLTICLEGEMHYTLNGAQAVLRAGDAILIPKGSVRRRFFTNVPNYYASFNIHTEEQINFDFSGVIHGCTDEHTESALILFGNAFRPATPGRDEKCAALFAYLYESIKVRAVSPENPSVLTVKQYISEHLGEPLSLRKLANEVHFTQEYLCSLFKKHTGTTVMHYLTEARINRARQLMITRELPAYLIAERCGFSDYPSFSHAFRRIVGISPAEYRRRAREN